MRKAMLFLILPFVADALRFSEAPGAKLNVAGQSESMEAEAELDRCFSSDAKKTTRKHIAAKNWAALKQDSCMKGFEQELSNLESGSSDPADVGEWLDGDLKAPTVATPNKKGKWCKKLPSLIYIGMGHSGSTTLSSQLNAHKEMSYGMMKEHRFHFDKSSTHGNQLMYKKGFNMACDKMAFDGSIGYIFYTREQIQEVKRTLGPDVKILLMMRDPQKWMNSLNNDGGDGKTKGHQGCYADFLENWLSVFPREQMLIESSEDYFKAPQGTLDRIFKFAGVAPKTFTERELGHAAGRRRSPSMKMAKIEAYNTDPHNIDCARRLQLLSNRTFGWALKMMKTEEK